jgi:hypothetical protein
MVYNGGINSEWFQQRNVALIDWPLRSPDLSPIEDLEGLLADQIQEGGCQFGTLEGLNKPFKILGPIFPLRNCRIEFF